jgi:hypothetical protein
MRREYKNTAVVKDGISLQTTKNMWQNEQQRQNSSLDTKNDAVI